MSYKVGDVVRLYKGTVIEITGVIIALPDPTYFYSLDYRAQVAAGEKWYIHPKHISPLSKLEKAMR